MGCSACAKRRKEALKKQQLKLEQQQVNQDASEEISKLVEENTTIQLFAMARTLGLSPVSGSSAEALATMIITSQQS